MIHAVDGVFVLSTRHQWRPGSFDSLETARKAQRLTDTDLQTLQDAVKPLPITTDQIAQYRAGRIDD